MTELLIPSILFSIWTLFSIIFILRHKYFQTNEKANKKSFWNNSYLFESIPTVFPTLGIFCTALGITIGIWNFNTANIQNSIPELLRGLRLAFVATMAGIIGLIIFQKIIAIIQKNIDDNPNRPRKQTDELSAISELTFAIQKMNNDNARHFDNLTQSFRSIIELNVSSKLILVEDEISKIHKTVKENQQNTSENLLSINKNIISNKNELVEQVTKLREEQKTTADKANKNTDEIIKAMSDNNKLTAKKFDEFSELLKQNNTEALVEVMKRTTEQFNSQMSELINRLVKENFSELNNSVKNLNEWQHQNKEQIYKITELFQKTTELFTISATTLKEVAVNTQTLTSENSKLNQIVKELNKIMIEDGKFQEITNKIINTIETLQNTTDSFEETTSKLNEWVKNEKNFKEAALILTKKLEDFRDFNGDVWDKYRKEMTKAVSIVKETSTRLGTDLENINGEFYERLNNTLQNLDQCIQRFVPNNRRI